MPVPVVNHPHQPLNVVLHNVVKLRTHRRKRVRRVKPLLQLLRHIPLVPFVPHVPPLRLDKLFHRPLLTVLRAGKLRRKSRTLFPTRPYLACASSYCRRRSYYYTYPSFGQVFGSNDKRYRNASFQFGKTIYSFFGYRLSYNIHTGHAPNFILSPCRLYELYSRRSPSESAVYSSRATTPNSDGYSNRQPYHAATR